MEGGIRCILNSNTRNENLAGEIDASSAKYMHVAQDKKA